ncbi:hypothetical protein LUZ60_007856 [Juncus effusus]|nr:hypothetical protein LUZ60_007856 [Juncus effusus]
MGVYEPIANEEKTDLESGVMGSKNDELKKILKPASQRLVSLDVFRGITVVLMILVDDAGAFIPSINHSPWNGITLADFVMPFFLFIVGVALAFAYKRVSSEDRHEATKKAVLRTIKLFVLGLFLQGGYFHGVRSITFGVDITNIRIMGVLQRIAIAYLFMAICEIWLKNDDKFSMVDSGHALLKKYRYQLLVGFIVTLIYTILLYGVYVSDWQYAIIQDGDSSPQYFFVKCGLRGDTGPGCNAVGMIDRKILGLKHLYKRSVYKRSKQCSIAWPQNGPLPIDAPSWCQAPFDPEGLLSSVMAIVTCLIGLQFGHVIVHFKEHRNRIILWLIPSFSLLALGFSLDFFGMHMNKPLYTLSYTCVTGGAAGLLFAAIYILVDVYGFRKPTLPFEWMGIHALMIYILIGCNILPILIHGFYWRKPENNLLRLIGIGG